MAGIMDFLKDELAKTKRSFGLLGELKAKNDPKVKEFDEFERKLYEKSLIYKSMKDAFTAPMRAYTGEIDALGDPRSAMEEAMNTAGMAQLSYVDVPTELAEKGRLNGYEFRIDSTSGRQLNALAELLAK